MVEARWCSDSEPSDVVNAFAQSTTLVALLSNGLHFLPHRPKANLTLVRCCQLRPSCFARCCSRACRSICRTPRAQVLHRRRRVTCTDKGRELIDHSRHPRKIVVVTVRKAKSASSSVEDRDQIARMAHVIARRAQVAVLSCAHVERVVVRNLNRSLIMPVRVDFGENFV